MHRNPWRRGAWALIVTVLPVDVVVAQAVLTPPPMLQATCEVVKPGMTVAHDQHEERWARAIEGVNGHAPALAVRSVTGPATTCWLIALTSYDEMGKGNDRMMADAAYARALPGLMGADAQYVTVTRNVIATLRPDLSAGEMPNILSRRATMWSEWRVRPGPQEELFGAAVRAYRGAMERAGVKPEFRVFQVRQGAPSGTYWIFTSAASMAGFDAALANEPRIMASFTPEDVKVFDEYFSKAHISTVDQLWSYVPAQSSLTAEQRASDPFWKRKVQSAARP